MDCFVACAPRNDGGKELRQINPSGKILLFRIENYAHIPSVPPDKRGVRTSRTRGGMRWTFVTPDDGVDERTAKPCGPGARCRRQAAGEAKAEKRKPKRQRRSQPRTR